jgi:hypothetical protein
VAAQSNCGGEPPTKSDHKTDGAKRGGGVDLLRFYFYLDFVILSFKACLFAGRMNYLLIFDRRAYSPWGPCGGYASEESYHIGGLIQSPPSRGAGLW